MEAKINIAKILENKSQETEGNTFKEDAKWAINEFLKNLWHPAKEVPNYKEWILTKWYDEDDGGFKYEVDYLYSFVYWKDYIKKNNITKWCYIKDIKD